MTMGMGEALSLGCALAWAVGVIIYKRLGEDLPPLKLCLFKNLIVLALVVATVLALRSPIAPALGLSPLAWPDMAAATILLVVASGLVGIALADTLYLHALNTIGAGRMGVVGNLYSPFVIALSLPLLGERLEGLQILGFALVMLGILLVNAPHRGDPLPPEQLRRGMLIGALSIALMAITIVAIKRVLETEPFWWIVLLRVAGAVAGLLALYALLPKLRRQDRGNGKPIRWAVLFAGAFIGQYLSMSLWLAGYKYTDAAIASVLNESASVFIVLFAALFLGEKLDRRRALGVCVTMTGVVCMVW